MHVLLLNQYFPPDTAATARMARLVADALAQRHRVTVLAGRPSYDPAEEHPFYVRRRQESGNLVIERLGSTAFPRYRLWRRISNYLSYLALAVPRALMIRADLVLAMTDPPMAGIAGAVVATLRRRPFVYNIRDLYPDMALASGVVRDAWWVRAWDVVHRWALRRADRVIVLGEDMRERVVQKGVPAERVQVVRDGVIEPPPAIRRDHPVVQEIRSGFRFVVLHAGNLGFYGAWETLLRAVELLEGDHVGVVFIGDGAERERLELLANGSKRVRFLPYRPPQEVPYVLGAADLHIVTVRRGFEGVVVPSKLYPILAAGRPVLAVAPAGSDPARIVSESGCGLVADPDEPASVAAAIGQLAADPGRLDEMGQRAFRIAPHYDGAAQLAEFVRALEEVQSL